jgi:hypothetical protein
MNLPESSLEWDLQLRSVGGVPRWIAGFASVFRLKQLSRVLVPAPVDTPCDTLVVRSTQGSIGDGAAGSILVVHGVTRRERPSRGYATLGCSRWQLGTK